VVTALRNLNVHEIHEIMCVSVFFPQWNTGRAVSSNPVQPDAGSLDQADSTVGDRRNDEALPVSDVQNQ